MFQKYLLLGWSFQSCKKQKQCMRKIDKTYTFDFHVMIIPVLEAKIVNKENIIKQMISLAEKKMRKKFELGIKPLRKSKL